MIEKVTAVVPASGFSRRMGRNKLLLPWRDGTVLGHVLKLLSAFPWNGILVTVSDDAVAREAARFPVDVMQNPEACLGQSRSVVLAVRARPESAGWLFMSGDMPMLDAGVVETVRKGIERYPEDIVAARYAGRNGQPVYFPNCFREELLGLQGDHGGRTILRRHPDRIVYLDFKDPCAGLDLDTPQDYQRLLEVLKNEGKGTGTRRR